MTKESPLSEPEGAEAPPARDIAQLRRILHNFLGALEKSVGKIEEEKAASFHALVFGRAAPAVTLSTIGHLLLRFEARGDAPEAALLEAQILTPSEQRMIDIFNKRNERILQESLTEPLPTAE